MDEDGYGSSRLWHISSDISLDDVVLSVYYWDFLQVVLCDLANYCSAGMDWSLEQIENLQSSSRPIQMVLLRFWIYMVSIHAELDAMDQELLQGISQKASQSFLKYDIGDILDGFLMSAMWDI